MKNNCRNPSTNGVTGCTVTDMKLRESYFDMMCGGSKTVELRLNDGKRREIKPSDIIRFTCAENPAKTLLAEVTALHRADSFGALLSDPYVFGRCGLSHLGISGAVALLGGFYSEDEERKWGVVGIEIKVSHK